jgi:hypothetical protein
LKPTVEAVIGLAFQRIADHWAALSAKENLREEDPPRRFYLSYLRKDSSPRVIAFGGGVWGFEGGEQGF